jgi:transcriptional regulator with XRE-family HTH domain
MPQNKHPNDLARYRRRMRLSQAEVATLLGYKDPKHVSDLELGRYFPSIPTALKLGAIYRVPIDFLFSHLYMHFRGRIREAEASARSAEPQVQSLLPLSSSADAA